MKEQEANIYLAGGGVKCCYQPIFLKEYEKKHKINNIIGLSFGAFIGYACTLGYYEETIDFCKKITPESLIPCYDKSKMINIIKKIPFIGLKIAEYVEKIIKIIWIMYAISGKGFYIQNFGTEFMEKLKKKDDYNQNKHKLKKFWCLVYNVSKNKLELINGLDPFIDKYIAASCSLWLIFQPLIINGNEYIDPGFDRLIPFGEDLELLNEEYKLSLSKANIDILCTTYNIKYYNDNHISTNQHIHFTTGLNLFEYLDNLISLLIDFNQYYKYNYEWKNKLKRKTLIINYIPPIKKGIDVNHELIKKMLDDGKIIWNKTNSFEFNSNNLLEFLH